MTRPGTSGITSTDRRLLRAACTGTRLGCRPAPTHSLGASLKRQRLTTRVIPPVRASSPPRFDGIWVLGPNGLTSERFCRTRFLLITWTSKGWRIASATGDALAVRVPARATRSVVPTHGGRARTARHRCAGTPDDVTVHVGKGDSAGWRTRTRAAQIASALTSSTTTSELWPYHAPKSLPRIDWAISW